MTPATAEASTAPARGAFTPRAALLSVVLSTLGVWWSLQVSLVHQSVYIGGSVPPIPAVATLLGMSALYPLLKRLGWSAGEMLLVFLFVSIVTFLTDPNSILLYLVAFLVVARREQQAAAPWVEWLKPVPPSVAPTDEKALQGFVEGHAPVPWGVWALPLLGWGAFCVALWTTTYAILRLFRDRWVAGERLPFPMVDMAMHLAPATGRKPIWREPLFFVGMGISSLFNGLNILSAFQPNIPALGRFIDIGAGFSSPPWSALAPVWISLRPEIFGIGYLMSTDVLLSVWLSYVALRLASVGALAAGYEVASGYYDYQEIAAGAYLAVLLTLLGLGRMKLTTLWRTAGEALARDTKTRRLATVALGGFVFQVLFAMQVGMFWWLAALHIALILAFAIVYARIRSETGAPNWYLFPFWQQQKLLLNVFGSANLAADGGGSLAALALMGFLSRSDFPQVAAFQSEGMAIGEQLRLRSGSVRACLLGALPFGLALGLTLTLVYCYRDGFYQLDSFRAYIANLQYKELVQWRSQPAGPNLPLILHTVFGAALTLGMAALRTRIPGFALHPLGFAMGTSYGFHLWFPFFAVWLIKLLVLRYGGMPLFRRGIPLFLGIVLGHYFMVGVVWGLLALYVPDLTRNFVVHFA